MSSWEGDKKWADNYNQAIKTIIGNHLITVAPIEEDRDHNTDLICFNVNGGRMSCRMRKKENCKPQYANEFTIRFDRPRSGNKTEFEKIVEGWGDYFFYGIGDDSNYEIPIWTICDLSVFRIEAIMAIARGKPLGYPKVNRDGSSSFRIYQFAEFSKKLLIHKQRDLNEVFNPSIKVALPFTKNTYQPQLLAIQ